MCDTSAYVMSGGSERLLLENVDVVRQVGDDLYIKNLFGEEKTIKGVIREVLLRENKIVLELSE